ncbi:MAG TPA: Pycsar system effector family protein [Pyrinomonadaceae bacterium]|jgi:hypothetical protein|nr:Pycsar system effector family protein [Pyrinomonadaceae bacterium]
MPENTLEYSRRLYERVIDWYKNADSKAQIILTLNGAFVAFLTSSIFKNPDELLKLTNKFSAFTWLFLSLMCVCLVGSIVCALMCLWSRIAFSAERDEMILSQIENLKETGEYSPNLMLFFKTIAMLDAEKFQTQLTKIDPEFEIKALASQIYLLSKRVYAKHLLVNYGFASVGGALIFFLLGGISYLANLR